MSFSDIANKFTVVEQPAVPPRRNIMFAVLLGMPTDVKKHIEQQICEQSKNYAEAGPDYHMWSHDDIALFARVANVCIVVVDSDDTYVIHEGQTVECPVRFIRRVNTVQFRRMVHTRFTQENLEHFVYTLKAGIPLDRRGVTVHDFARKHTLSCTLKGSRFGHVTTVNDHVANVMNKLASSDNSRGDYYTYTKEYLANAIKCKKQLEKRICDYECVSESGYLSDEEKKAYPNMHKRNIHTFNVVCADIAEGKVNCYLLTNMCAEMDSLGKAFKALNGLTQDYALDNINIIVERINDLESLTLALM